MSEPTYKPTFRFFKRQGFGQFTGEVVGGEILLAEVSGYVQLLDGRLEVRMRGSDQRFLLDREDASRFAEAWTGKPL